jgi:hypothetical protein
MASEFHGWGHSQNAEDSTIASYWAPYFKNAPTLTLNVCGSQGVKRKSVPTPFFESEKYLTLKQA